MRIAIPVYPGFAATDAIGPYEVLARLPKAQLLFVASAPGVVASDTGFLKLVAEPLSAMPRPDIIVVPGAPNAALPVRDEAYLAWLREAHRHAQWTTSVCSGALILGVAGILRGKRATTHWLDVAELATHGATVADARVVFDGNVVTAAGVTAGYDMALALAARIAGDDYAMALQLGLEYDPRPPFTAGSPRTAPAHVVAMVRQRAAAEAAAAAAASAAKSGVATNTAAAAAETNRASNGGSGGRP